MRETPDSAKSPIDVALMTLGTIRDEVAVLGANDNEIPSINALIEAVKTGSLAPEVAIKRAKEIRDVKQEYH